MDSTWSIFNSAYQLTHDLYSTSLTMINHGQPSLVIINYQPPVSFTVNHYEPLIKHDYDQPFEGQASSSSQEWISLCCGTSHSTTEACPVGAAPPSTAQSEKSVRKPRQQKVGKSKSKCISNKKQNKVSKVFKSTKDMSIKQKQNKVSKVFWEKVGKPSVPKHLSKNIYPHLPAQSNNEKR